MTKTEKALEFLGFWVEFLKLPGLDKELDPYVWNTQDEAALSTLREAVAELDALKAEIEKLKARNHEEV